MPIDDIDKEIESIEDSLSTIKWKLKKTKENSLLLELLSGLFATNNVEETGHFLLRLPINKAPKLALGVVVRDVMADLSNKPPTSPELKYRVFVESGSTTALAMLGAKKLSGGVSDRIRLHTNNLFAYTSLCDEYESHLMFGGAVLMMKYGGFFPVSQQTFSLAFANQGTNTARAREKIRREYGFMTDDAAKYSRLFLTCSEYHLRHGPFVGSQENVLLKAAYFGYGRNIDMLIDGGKIIKWDDPNPNVGRCINVFGGEEEAGNPCSKLLLRPPGEAFEWENIMYHRLKNSQSLRVHIANPAQGPPVEIRALVDKANKHMKKIKIKINDKTPRLTYVDLQTNAVSSRKTDANGEPVDVWSMEYVLK